MTSPKSPAVGSPKAEKESFFDKLGGTIGRKKKLKEVTDLRDEGRDAIDSPDLYIDLSWDDMEEGEEKYIIDQDSQNDPKLKELTKLLVDWTNDVLAKDRIIVKDILDDFYDGQVFQKIVENESKLRIGVPEVSQSVVGQKQKLREVLETINTELRIPETYHQHKWSVELIHGKNLVAILHLLITLARHYRAPIRLPENVCVTTLIIQKTPAGLQSRRSTEEITTTNDDIGARYEPKESDRDAFDTMFDHAPDRLQSMKRLLSEFANRHLNKINLEVSHIENQFHDGVYLILLMGLLEGYFVPLFSFQLTPTTFEQKVGNVTLSFELMQDAGLPKPKARAEGRGTYIPPLDWLISPARDVKEAIEQAAFRFTLKQLR